MAKCLKVLMLVVLGLPLFACKNGDSKNVNTQSFEKPYIPVTKEVHGDVVLNSLQNASVVAYRADGGDVDYGTPIGASTTDVDGKFVIDIDSTFSGFPLVIVVSAEPGDTAVCMSLFGCRGRSGEVSFSEIYELSEPVVLRLGISNLDFQAQYFISIFSEIGVHIAERGRLEYSFRERLNLAHAEVSSFFGLGMPLEEHKMVDITFPKELRDANDSEVRASLVQSSIISALSVEGSRALSEVLAQLNYQMLTKGIPGNLGSGASGVVTSETIYKGVDELLDHLELSSAFSLFANQVAAARNVFGIEDNGNFRIASREKQYLPSIEDRAKLFVQDLRQVAASINFTNLSKLSDFGSFFDQEGLEVFDDFGVELDSLSQLFSSESTSILNVLLEVSLASVNAVVSNITGSGLPDNVNGIQLNSNWQSTSDINNIYDHATFSIRQWMDACDGVETCDAWVDLRIEVDLTNAVATAAVRGIRSDSIDISIDGVIRYEGLELSFEKRDQKLFFDDIQIRMEIMEQGTEDELTSKIKFIAHSAELRIPFTETFEASPDVGEEELIILGVVDAGLFMDKKPDGEGESKEKFIFTSESNESDGFGSSGEPIKVVRDIYNLALVDQLSFNLAAKTRRDNGDSFLGGLSVNNYMPFSERGINFVYKSQLTCSEGDLESICEPIEAGFNIEGETEDDFARLNVTAIFNAKLKGVADPLFMEISGSRESPSLMNIEQLKLYQPGRSMVLSGEFTNTGVNRLDAVNQDGLTMKIDMPEGGGERFGGIWSANGEQLATMKDFRTWLKITFRDGYFVSM